MTEKRIPLAVIKAAWNDHSLTFAQVADRIGVHECTLRRWRSALQLPPRPLHQRGRRNAQVNPSEFASLWERGIRIEDLARHFGRSPPTISKIAKRMKLSYRGPSFKGIRAA